MKQRVLAWLVIFAGMFISRAGFLENVVYNIDEAEYAVAARGLDHGLLTGVDFLGSTKTPGIVFLYNALFHIFGESLGVTRGAYIVLLILEGLVLVELAMLLWGPTAALPAALLFWAIANSFEIPPDMLALNAEGPAMFFAVLALWLAWWKPQKVLALCGAGAAFGLACMFRQSAVFFALPVAVAVLHVPEGKLRRLSTVYGAALIVWLPVVLLYASHHALGWAWYSWVHYPLAYAGDVTASEFSVRLCSMTAEYAMQEAIPAALALSGLMLLAQKGFTPKTIFLTTLLLGSVLAVCSGSRFFGHYWVQFFPVTALFGIPAWLHVQEGSRRAKLTLTAAVGIAALVAGLHFNTWRTWDPYATPRGVSFFRLGAGGTDLKLAAFAREHLAPDETIALWGYCPQIYWYADRFPAVRDYMCHYSAGYSPGVSNLAAERNASAPRHPRAMAMYIEDLERSQPRYIFDLSPVRDYTFSFDNYPISAFPELARYVRERYLTEGTVGDALVYRRRTPNDPWRPDEPEAKLSSQ